MELTFPEPPPEDCHETRVWLPWVKARGTEWGWRHNHTFTTKSADNRWITGNSSPGFPDLTLVRGRRLVFAELKGHRGRVEPAQDEWLDLLAEVPGVEVYVWRPRDWRDVVEALRPRS